MAERRHHIHIINRFQRLWIGQQRFTNAQPNTHHQSYSIPFTFTKPKSFGVANTHTRAFKHYHRKSY